MTEEYMSEEEYAELKAQPSLKKEYRERANKVFEPNGLILKDKDIDRKHKFYWLLTFIALVLVIGYSSYQGYYKSSIAFAPNITSICEGVSYNLSCPDFKCPSHNITCPSFPDEIKIKMES